MKKTLISLSLLTALASAVNAQDAATTSGSEFKPGAGNVTVEVLAQSPFNGADDRRIFNLNNNALRFRYFLNENLAVRLGFSIAANRRKEDFGSTSNTSFSSNSNSGPTNNNSGSSSETPIAYKLTSGSTYVNIAPGIEIHKNVSERLSVYYGGYIDFAMQSAKGKITGTPGSSSSNSTNVTTTTTTTTSNTSAYAGEYTYDVKGQDLSGATVGGNWSAATALGGSTSPVNNAGAGNRAFTRVGLFGVIGADYYITKALYLGLECSWGFASTSFKKIKTEEKMTNIITQTTRTDASGTTTTTYNGAGTNPPATVSSTETSESNRDSNWNIAPAVNAAFRFGFWF